MSVVYCIVPRHLAAELHEPVREFFRAESGVQVVVEQRGAERRRGGRRKGALYASRDRRAVRNIEGRRVADRRSSTRPTEDQQLPPAAVPHAGALIFVEREEPSSRGVEDAESARLVIRAQQGDDDAVAELYLRYYEPLYSYLKVQLRDSHEAEDVLQDVFAQILAILPTYDIRAEHPFRVLLYRIARNRSIDHLRKSARADVEMPSDIARRREAAVAADPAEMLQRLSDTELAVHLRRLPDNQLHVLLLRYMLDFTPQETAAVLDTSPDGARASQYRALQYLRRVVKPPP